MSFLPSKRPSLLQPDGIDDVAGSDLNSCNLLAEVEPRSGSNKQAIIKGASTATTNFSDNGISKQPHSD